MSTAAPALPPEVTAELNALKAENITLKAKIAELSVAPVVIVDEKAKAKAELSRISEINSLCELAKVSDKEKDLFISAGFSRAEAQDYLKSSGKLSAQNKPVDEGGTDLDDKKKTPDEKFGAEYDANSDIYMRQSLSRFDYINSRRIDDGLPPHPKQKAA